MGQIQGEKEREMGKTGTRNGKPETDRQGENGTATGGKRKR